MLKTNTFINDYEISFNVELFADNKFQHIEEMIGNPFYQFKPFMGFFKKQKSNNNTSEAEWLLNENLNMFQRIANHPLKNQHHSYLLHHLYDHTFLAWQDIVDIEEIWIEIELTIQNFTILK